MTIAHLIKCLCVLADKYGDDIEVMKRSINVADGSTRHLSLLLPKANELKDEAHGIHRTIVEL